MRDTSLPSYLLLLLTFTTSESIGEMSQSKSHDPDAVGWLRACHPDHRIDLQSTQCKNGFTIDKVIDKGCICVHGLWLVASNHCDPDPVLLYGQGECFQIQKPISHVIHLACNNDPNISKTHILTKHGVQFNLEPLAAGQLDGNHTFTIIRLNPTTNLIYQPHGLPEICLDAAAEALPSSTQNAVSVIMVTRSGEFVEFTETTAHHCEPLQDLKDESLEYESTKLFPGHGLTLGRGLKLAMEKCEHKCDATGGHGRVKRFLPSGQIKVDGFFGYSDSKQEDVDRYFKEQNWKIIKAELKYLKYMQKFPYWQLADPDWAFLQITRQILASTCPVAEVSDLLMKAVTRLFRYILVDRREDNLYGPTEVENDKREKIMSALSVCLNESVPYNFTYEYDPSNCYADPQNPDESSSNGTAEGAAPASKVQLCTCTKRYTGVQLNDTVNNTCVGLDDELAWNSRERDFLTETIWKTFQFVHYHCAQFFSSDGSDLSVYHERVERFFHTDVILRWNSPGESSKKLWDYFFFSYDLPSFSRGLDTCVCSAKTHSQYVQPMVRPSIPTLRKKRAVGFLPKENMRLNSHYSCIIYPEMSEQPLSTC